MITQNASQKVFSGTIYNYIGRFVSLPVAFITSVYLVRILDIEEYGLYSILFSFNTYFLILSYLGIPNILQRYVPELHQHGNYHELRKLISYGLILRLCITCILIGFCLLFLGNISQILKAPKLVDFLPIFLVIILVQTIINNNETILEALLCQKYQNIVKSLYTITRLLLIYILLTLNYGLMGVLIALVISDVLLSIAYLIRVYTLVYREGRENAGSLSNRRIIKYGLYTAARKMGSVIFDASTDIYLITYFLGTASAGYYSFAYRHTEFLFQFTPSVLLFSVLTPVVIQKYTESKSKEFLSSVFSSYNKITIFLSLPLVAIGVIFSKQIISIIFGVKYLPAHVAFILWLTFAGTQTLQAPLKLILFSLERVNILFYSQVFIIYNIVGDILLIPTLGIEGAALATGTSRIFCFLMILYMSKRHIRLQYPWKSISKMLFNTLLMSIILYLLRPYVVNISSLVLISLAGFLIYMACTFFNKVFNSKENEIFHKAIPFKLPNF